jgi:hypothetical protein
MSIQIWISSYIPKDIPNYTKPVPDGSGRTMIPGPLPTSDCFLTDQRSFSENVLSSSRLRSHVELDHANFNLRKQEHHCDSTVEIDCEDGDIECEKVPDTSGLKVTNFGASANVATFTFDGGAGNPCVGIAAPDIDWLVHVKVQRDGPSFSVLIESGSVVEPFPAFEMYVEYSGETKPLFTRSPNPGATPWNLIGPPNQPVSGFVTF